MAIAVTYLDKSIEFLKGVGPQKADLFRKELEVFTIRDLLYTFPYKYVDRSTFTPIAILRGDETYVQIKGVIRQIKKEGTGPKQRLKAVLQDTGGSVELVWFAGLKWIESFLLEGVEYIVFGRIQRFGHQMSISHPEIELMKDDLPVRGIQPVYYSTDKLNSRGMDVKFRRKLIHEILSNLIPENVQESIPEFVRSPLRLMTHFEALNQVHMPDHWEHQKTAENTLKFEELFVQQLDLLQQNRQLKKTVRGYFFEKIGDFFNGFFHNNLKFDLTEAQKKVIKEIRRDMGSGRQMNRLLQGDVGSGKTVVSLMTMLIAIDNGFQACLMAPTEILAQQHYNSITKMLTGLDVKTGFLSGSIKGKERSRILKELKEGEIKIIIGTHALLEDPVEFADLGIAITDEQHRFGVQQRARLWNKGRTYPPHILVMTATPIPRTLAMTQYGDLDVSVIDELPPGRTPIVTVKKTEYSRPKMYEFLKEQIALGRQVYFVYPLIEESEKLDLEDLNNGYEQLLISFPRPEYQISVVHGRMKQADKDAEMAKFINKTTQIMVATTVIEVGVDVPNATVMVIENAERFGLSQLHQLRGRVGRGANQSFCILMTSYKVSREAAFRLKIMCDTGDGFKIAEADLELRGPGALDGLQQSGAPPFKIANLLKDGALLRWARNSVEAILEEDPLLESPQNIQLRHVLEKYRRRKKAWSKIG